MSEASWFVVCIATAATSFILGGCIGILVTEAGNTADVVLVSNEEVITAIEEVIESQEELNRMLKKYMEEVKK